MSVIQEVYIAAMVSLEPEEAQSFEETRVLPSAALERGITVSANGPHYIPAAKSWTGDDINFSLEDTFTLSAKFIDEAEANADSEEDFEDEDDSSDED